MQAQNRKVEYEAQKVPPAYASYLTTIRYPTVWHRAYLMCNPREDITLRLDRKPTDALYTFVSWWRDADWMPFPFIVLSYLLAMWLTATFYIRRVWRTTDGSESLSYFRRQFYKVMAIPPLVILVGALLFFAANMLAKHNQDNYTILTLIYSILLIGYLGAVTIMLCNFWFTQLPDMESNLPPRTLSRAVWVCIGCYYLLFPFWCVITAKLDQIVTG